MPCSRFLEANMLKLCLLNLLYGILLAGVFICYGLLRRQINRAERKSDIKRVLLAMSAAVILILVQAVFEFFVLDPLVYELRPSVRQYAFAGLCRAVMAMVGIFTAVKLNLVKMKAEEQDEAQPSFVDFGDGVARMRGDFADRDEEQRRIEKL